MPRLVFVVSRLVSVLCLAVLALAVVFDTQAGRYTEGRIPAEFAKRLDPALTGDYGNVFSVAHNAGDDLAAATRAVAWGVDAIEIDVRSTGGELFASHDAQIPLLEDIFFRGPTLADAWQVGQLRDTVLLHLKERSLPYLEHVRAFLLARPRRKLLVQTHEPSTLRWAKRRIPWARRLLLVFNDREVKALRTDPSRLAAADGVSVRESLLTGAALSWLEARRLTVVAWTVNDETRMNQLIAGGVQGLITERLDIMRLLGEGPEAATGTRPG
jgi:glycerophosphoryl diester phosphodiesterase